MVGAAAGATWRQFSLSYSLSRRTGHLAVGRLHWKWQIIFWISCLASLWSCRHAAALCCQELRQLEPQTTSCRIKVQRAVTQWFFIVFIVFFFLIFEKSFLCLEFRSDSLWIKPPVSNEVFNLLRVRKLDVFGVFNHIYVQSQAPVVKNILMGCYKRTILLLRNRTDLLRMEYKVITCGGACMFCCCCCCLIRTRNSRFLFNFTVTLC